MGHTRMGRPSHGPGPERLYVRRYLGHHLGMNAERSARSSRRTKVVATIGPASIGIVDRLIAAGLDVARINFSHGSDEDHLHTAEIVRAAAAAAGRTARP